MRESRFVQLVIIDLIACISSIFLASFIEVINGFLRIPLLYIIVRLLFPLFIITGSLLIFAFIIILIKEFLSPKK